MAQVIGESSADMTWTNEGPSSIGSLIADILREKEGAQVSLVNTGGIRADLPKGPITLGKIFEILPFDSDQVVTFQIQGKNIRKIVEQNAKNLGKSRTLQFSGLAYAIKGNKVTTIQIDGRPLDPEQWYKIATVDFVFSAFVEQVNVTPQASVNVKFSHPRDVNETGINLRDLVIDYIKEHKIIRPLLTYALYEKINKLVLIMMSIRAHPFSHVDTAKEVIGEIDKVNALVKKYLSKGIQDIPI